MEFPLVIGGDYSLTFYNLFSGNKLIEDGGRDISKTFVQITFILNAILECIFGQVIMVFFYFFSFDIDLTAKKAVNFRVEIVFFNSTARQKLKKKKQKKAVVTYIYF